MTDRQLRWRGAIAATILLVTAGLVDGNPVLLLGATIPLAYVAYGSLSSVTAPDGLSATRTVSSSPAPPGRPVTVTLEVTNESDRTITDLRVADGVPDELAVLEGSPRAGATLEPGEAVTVTYLLVARRGEYDFEPPQCRVRGLGASAVATTAASPAGDTSLVCRLDADAPPIEEIGTDRIGRLTTDRPGDGISFHSSREYRTGDPAERIDWRHYAKRGTLATINYERQVAATVVVVVDARALNYVVAGRGRPTAVEFAAYAAMRTLADLLGHGHDVGVAVVGCDGDGPAGLRWLAPTSSREQRTRALEILRLATDAEPGTRTNRSTGTSNWTTSSSTASDPKGGSRTQRQVRKVLELAPTGAQVALFSPLLDDPPVAAVERWRGAGLPVVTFAPDVIPDNTVSGQYAQLRRRTRLGRCQAAGARAFDWRRGTPLPLLIEHAFSADARLSSGRLGGRRGGAGGGGAGSSPATETTSGADAAASSNSDPDPGPISRREAADSPSDGGDD